MSSDRCTRSREDGCTAPGCGTQNTVSLDARHGRRCLTHLPPGAEHLVDPYDADVALAMVDAGNPAGAFAWLRAHLTRRAAA